MNILYDIGIWFLIVAIVYWYADLTQRVWGRREQRKNNKED